MNKNKPSPDLNKNEEYLKNLLGSSNDIVYRHFAIRAFNNCEILLVYIMGLANIKKIDDFILRPLTEMNDFSIENKMISAGEAVTVLMQSGILTPSVTLSSDWDEICDRLLSGDVILFLNGSGDVIINSLKGWENRSLSEPSSDAEIRGSKDGFVESIRINTSLIRRRIRDYGLRIDSLKIGKRTKTDIVLVYIDKLVNKEVLNELKKRLDKIDTDAILESAYIEEFIEDSPASVFPQILTTERPDRAAAAILEGKITIIIDNTPFVLIVPSVFWDFMQAAGDYYESPYIASFLRVIRVISLVISLTLPSLYVLLVSFHQEMIPTPLAMKMAAGREGIPYPSIIEALFMELIFEILREAGIRIPKPIGQAVSIVGALVIGEAAVQAGIVAPLMVIVVAAAGICSFTVPGYNAASALRLTRFPIMIATGVLGVLGFFGATAAIILHLLSLRSFGAPYLAPFSPFRFRDNKRDSLIRFPHWHMTGRASTSGAGGNKRQAESEALKPRQDK